MAKRMAENWLRASCARTARAILFRDQWRASFPDPLAQLRNHEIKLIICGMSSDRIRGRRLRPVTEKSGSACDGGMRSDQCGDRALPPAMTNSGWSASSGQHPNTEDHQGSFQEGLWLGRAPQLRERTQAGDGLETIEFDCGWRSAKR